MTALAASSTFMACSPHHDMGRASCNQAQLLFHATRLSCCFMQQQHGIGGVVQRQGQRQVCSRHKELLLLLLLLLLRSTGRLGTIQVLESADQDCCC